MKAATSVNRKQAKICKERGHGVILSDKWSRCKWCGLWVREVCKLEERESDPPENERDLLTQSEELLAKCRTLEQKAVGHKRKKAKP